MQNYSSLAVSSYSRLFTGLILLILAALIACRKGDAEISSGNYSQTISTYLESQKFVSTSQSDAFTQANKNIDLLKNNLGFGSAKTELLDDKINLVVVPVKDGLISEKNLDRNSTLALLLMTNRQGNIISGNIVYFVPSDQKKHSALPANTLCNLLSGKDVVLDGTYKMLTLSGRWLSQFGIKDKKLSSSGIVEKGSSAGNGAGRSTECTHWYLITTFYWMDGSTTRTEEYLGTTCSSDCGGNGGYATVCGVEGEEGGSGSGPDDIIWGEEGGSTTETTPTPSASLTGEMDPNGGPRTVTYQAAVTYLYDRKIRQFTSFTGGRPYPVPVSQPFTDDNGNPAVLYNSTGNWSFSYTPVSYNSRMARWDLVGIYNYVFTIGALTLWKNKYISKVIVGH